jgi:hypothetical protein
MPHITVGSRRGNGHAKSATRRYQQRIWDKIRTGTDRLVIYDTPVIKK